MTIVGTAVAAGSVMTAAAVSGFCWVMGEPSSAIIFGTMGVVVGGVLGLISAAYLVPLLVNTRVSRSLMLVMGISVPLGILFGLVHPFVGAFVALVVQVTTAVVARIVFPVGRDLSVCGACGYDLRGIVARVCPECGWPIDRRGA